MTETTSNGQANKKSDEAENFIRVITRIRPNFRNEINEIKDQPLLEALDKNTMLFRHLNKGSSSKVDKFFDFFRVFDAKATTEQIFNEILKDSLYENVFGYKNTLIISGGCEKAGKTHSMIGQMAQPGLILHCVRDLLTKIQDREFKQQTT